MQIPFSVFEAAIHCEYKAWQLIRENNCEGDSQVSEINTKNKLAFEAFNYHKFEAINPRTKEKVKIFYETVQQLANKKDAPEFYKNAHCVECKFWTTCFEKLKQRDCISLLPSMTPKILLKYHSKGIFTILQLSHQFRLRRKRTKSHASKTYLWELKALAIREQKTYILQLPEINDSPTSIYLDFEGLPEENFIYLIGIIIRKAGEGDKIFSLWADEKKNEEEIFSELHQLLMQYPNANIFHYGSYEIKALKKHQNLFCAFENRMINILSFFRTHIYAPTYSNSLKEIAGFLGFTWRDDEANGLKSIKWRKDWQRDKEENYKLKLLTYNLDDCYALIKVHQWISQLHLEHNVQMVSKMKKHTPFSLQRNDEFGDDFNYINKAAYFNYQHSKIYWRNKGELTRRRDPTIHYGKGHAVWKPKKINEVIQIPPLTSCPHCGHKKLYRLSKQRTFLQTDLKFTAKGVKQWVIEYRSGCGKCAKCLMKYNDSILRMLHYGDNLFAWAVNLYVNYRISYAGISRLLQEQFGVWTNPTYFNDRNYEWWKRFKPQVEGCLKTILKSHVIHIDETTVRLGKGKDKGYVWVLATSHTVYYHFSFTREVGFISELLKDYTGVIVTDFFAGYDSLQLNRQKCLIHLIRDLNDDLFKHPFDEEYKRLVAAFSELLKKIVATIDLYGLKKHFLKKHEKDTNRFYKNFIETKQSSELTIKYSKRLKKHWKELWMFLRNDGVPWNNNNAEAAIKAFAIHRRSVNGQVSDTGLKEYLSMLSIAQTCRYRNISFLDFLRGKESI